MVHFKYKVNCFKLQLKVLNYEYYSQILKIRCKLLTIIYQKKPCSFNLEFVYQVKISLVQTNLNYYATVWKYMGI
jgi:hypothetical protein